MPVSTKLDITTDVNPRMKNNFASHDTCLKSH